MSKELSPLEALEVLVNDIDQHYASGFIHRIDRSNYKIIEAALKEYEKKTELAKEYKDVNNVAKRLKAFEIIKKKRVDVNDLLNFVSLEAYNEYVCACDDNDKRTLTQDEYDLLKEVLL